MPPKPDISLVARRRGRRGADRRRLAVSRALDRRPRDPDADQQPRQPRRHGRRARRPAAAAVARRARPLAARRLDRRAPARRAAASPRGRGHDVVGEVRPARLGAPAHRRHAGARARGSPHGGHRALRRQGVSDDAEPRRPLGDRPRAAPARPRRWRRSTAPSSSPRPTSTWACCRPSGRPASTTRARSGAATGSSSWRRSGSRPRCACARS